MTIAPYPPDVTLYGPDGAPLLPSAAPIADGAANPTTAATDARLSAWNGATWDREYNNTQGVLLASAPRTATATSSIITNYNRDTLTVWIHIDAAGTGYLAVYLVVPSPTLEEWHYVPDSAGVNNSAFTNNAAQINAVGHFACQFGPGLANATATAVANEQVVQTVNVHVPRTLWVAVIPSDASSWTYAADYALS